MKNITKIIWLWVLILLPLICYSADSTVEKLPPSSPASESIFYVVDKPFTSGTSDNRLSLGNLLLWMATQNWTLTGSWDFTGATVTGVIGTGSGFDESVDDLISLSGVAEGSTHLGTFSGSIITNNQSIKEALQELETAIEDIEVPEETNPFEFAKKDDVVIGTGDGTAGRLAKGDNNTLLGVDQTGKLGYHKYMSVILADPSMLGDGGATFSYSGIVKKFVCGENLTASNVVYCKNVGGAARCFKYKANGDDKTMPPRALALSDCAAVADFYGLVFGTMKNNSWGMTNNRDEGKLIYGSTVAGGITLDPPSDEGDMIAILGYVDEENTITFQPSLVLTQVAGGGAGDEKAPTLETATIASNGATISLVFSEPVTVNDGTGWEMTTTGGATSMTYASGSGSTTLVYNLGRIVNEPETGTIAYTTTSNGIEDAAGNDLESIESKNYANNSNKWNANLKAIAKAYYTFEASNTWSDISGNGNTLAKINKPALNTKTPLEGAASVDFEYDNSQYAYITDGNLSSGFPLKSNESNKDFTWIARIRAESVPNDTYMAIMSKYDAESAAKCSALLSVDYYGEGVRKIGFVIGHTSGTDYEYVNHDSNISLNTHYLVAASHNNSNRSYAIRVRNGASGDVIGTDKTGKFSNAISLTDARFQVGCQYVNGNPEMYFDGLIDEVVVVSSILDADDITKVAKGIY